MKKILHIPILWGSVILFSLSAAAQQDSAFIRKQISALTSLWDLHIDDATAYRLYDSLSNINKLFLQRSVTNDTSNAKIDLLMYQQQQIKADKGLIANAGYLENFNSNQGEDDLLYLRRAQAGLDWNILGEGLYGNHNRMARLSNEAAIERLKIDDHVSSGNELLAYNTIIYVFNRQKTELLDQRKQIVDAKLEILNQLYAHQAIDYLTYLDTKKQKADIDAMYGLYLGYNQEMRKIMNDSALEIGSIPVFDIDAERMFSYAGITTNADSINKLLLANLALENKPVNSVKLDVFIRYNYYGYASTAANTSRGFVSAGAGLSVPFSAFSQYNRQVVSAEQRVLTMESQEQTDSRELTLADLLYEFRYKLKQYEAFESKRREYIELLRIEKVKEHFHDLEFNPVTSLTLLDELIQIDIEMTDLRQQLCLKLLEISHEIPGVQVTSYIRNWTPLIVPQNLHSMDRSLYIWSSSVMENNADAIRDFVRDHSINTCIISPGKKSETFKKAKTLIDTLTTAGTDVQLLIGENSLLTRKDPAAYFDSVYQALGAPRITALHLDVEPHVMDDWSTKKDIYLAEYVTLLKNAASWCKTKNIRLAVSIPVFYPKETLVSIYQSADLVYVMAYETTDAGKIVERTKEERSIDATKTIIAVRCRDFEREEQMNDFLFLLGDKVQRRSFAIHDLGTYSKLKP